MVQPTERGNEIGWPLMREFYSIVNKGGKIVKGEGEELDCLMFDGSEKYFVE